MGVMTRKAGENFIITSDRIVGEAPTNCAPKKRATDVFLVWTGNAWSAAATEAKIFPALDVADDYVRSHYVEVMGQMKR